MSALVLLTMVYSAMGSSEAADKPVVSFSPNWSKIFVYESVTITCNVHAGARGNHRFYWYKDNRRLPISNQSFTIEFADEAHAGNYRCKTTENHLSQPSRLSVMSGWVILQAPLLIYEGDVLSLKCHSFPGCEAKNAMFFLDNAWQNSSGESVQVGKMNTTGANTYKCKKDVYCNSRNRSHTDMTTFNVTDLFTEPEIKVKPYSPTVGAAATLTCDTNLTPLRAGTELHFAFYKDGQKLGEFGLSNIYRINTALPAHSGNYTCEAKTPNDRIKKTSKTLHLQIDMSLLFLGLVLVAALLIILIPTGIIFKRRWRQLPQPTVSVRVVSPQEEDTYTYIDIRHVGQGHLAPAVQPDQSTVTYAAVRLSESPVFM